MPTPVNPYSPPEVTSELGTPVRERLSRLNQVLVTIAALSFLIFTWLLLNSTPGDRKGGQVFLLNVPFVLAWGVTAWAAPRHCFVAAIVCGVMQCVVSVVMLILGIGDLEIVLPINVSIAAVPVAMAYRTRPRHTSPGEQETGAQ